MISDSPKMAGTELGTAIVGMSDPEQLALESAAFTSFARLLGRNVELLSTGPTLGLLIETLSELGADEAATLLASIDEEAVGDPSDLIYTWNMLFIRGTVPPYETSYMTPSLVGHTSELADIAGFYRAFGFQVEGERPDHLLPEIEFAALAALQEAQAIKDANSDAIDIVHNARESFFASHLGCWVDDFASRLERSEATNPYLPVLFALSSFVDHICSEMGIEPRKPVAITGPELGEVDTDDQPLECYGNPATLEELNVPEENVDRINVTPVQRDR